MVKGKKRLLTDKKELIIPASIHNRFDIEVIDSLTGDIKQRAFSENIILDKLWANFPTPWFAYIQYGTGSGTPEASRTTLFTYKGSKAITGTKLSIVSKQISTIQGLITLVETDEVGTVFTEIGISKSSSTSGLVTHAMLKDMNGNTISITKTNTDIIKIYATVFCHLDSTLTNIIPTVPYVGSNGSSGDPYTRALNYLIGFTLGTNINNQDKWGESILFATSPSVANFNSSVMTTKSWNSAQKKLTVTANRLAVGTGNDNAITDIYVGNDFSVKNLSMIFSIKDLELGSDIIGEAIGTGDGETLDYTTKFCKVSDCIVYVDGVEATGYTIDTDIPFISTNVGNVSLFKVYNFIGDEMGRTAFSNWFNLTDLPTSGNDPIIIYENLYNDKISVTKLTRSSTLITNMEMSDDLINWTTITSGSSIDAITGAMRYIRVTRTLPGNQVRIAIETSRTSDNNIHFATAPASGAVITADYHTDTIAKDVNHVFDFSFGVQFNEYTPA